MGRKKKHPLRKLPKNTWGIIKQYFSFTLKSIFHPKTYAKTVSRQKSLLFALIFFGLNLFFYFFLESVTNLTTSTHFYLNFYLAEAVLKMAGGIILGIIVVIFWHLFSKMLGGSASFKLGIITLCLSSTPLLFYWIQFLQPILFTWFLFSLTLNFMRSYKYSFIFSALSILIPTITVLLWLKSINLIQLPF